MSLTFAHIVVLLAAGVGLAFANTLASSGSAVSLPALLALSVGAEVANGTNRVAVFVGGIAAFISFARKGHVDWRNVLPFGAATVAGGILGVVLSELIAPTRLHVFIVIALFGAVAILCVKPNRWMANEGEREIKRGPLQLGLLFLVGAWTGFIVLDAAAFVLFILVFAIGYDLLRANAMKAVLLVLTAGASLPVLAYKDSIEWGPAGILSIGAVIGGLVAAWLAMKPGAARWVYRFLVLIIGGEILSMVLRAIHL